MMSASALGSARATARLSSSVDSIRWTSTPGGTGSAVGPAIKATSAPRAQAARARAKPMRPLDRLVITRTGSIGSRVGPAVTTTRRPWNGAALKSSRSAQALISSGSTIRPGPSPSPRASGPVRGPRTVSSRFPLPDSRSFLRLACVAGCRYIWSFIAGHRSSGALRASSSAVRKSSATPWAMRAMSCAVAGATMMRSHSRPRRTWSRARPRSHSEVSTGRPVRASKVTGRMNSPADAVSTTSTCAPSSVRRRATVHAL